MTKYCQNNSKYFKIYKILRDITRNYEILNYDIVVCDIPDTVCNKGIFIKTAGA
jgi:hypothetical protein